MVEVQTGGHRLLLYASAEEIPISRYSRFQRYSLIESGVGSDMDAIGDHFGKLFQLLAQGMAPEALTEAKNLYYSLYLMLQEVNVPSMAFCCLLHSIDGTPLTDLSEDNLKLIVADLSRMGLTQESVHHWTDLLKKKINDELRRYFPGYFSDDEALNFYAKVKQRIDALATDNEAILAETDRYFAEYNAPPCFDEGSPDNAVMGLDKIFQSLCAVLESNGVTHAASLTAMEFYSRLDYFKRQAQLLTMKKPAV